MAKVKTKAVAKKAVAKKVVGENAVRVAELVQPAPVEIGFDFIKSNLFRVIHADGAYGGISPNGAIHMALYNERSPIPRHTAHRLENNQLGAELREKREVRSSFVREVEVDVIMDVNVATALHQWLGEKLAELHRQTQSLRPTQPAA